MQCKATNSRGEPCGITWGIEDGWCSVHSPDPERRAAVTEARRKGQAQSAHNRRKTMYRTLPPGRCPPAPETAADAVHWSSWATVQTASGNLDARTAREIAGLLRVFVQAIDKALLQKRINELEQLVRRAKKAGAL